MHGGIANDCRVNLRHVDSEEIERKGTCCLDTADGILVAPGFGTRGTEGKIMAARYARERAVPYFGICLGLQIAVIEFARNVAGLRGANSTEFEPNASPSGHRPSARAARRGGQGRDHAPGRVALHAQPGHARRGGVRGRRDLRAAPPSLRGQQ